MPLAWHTVEPGLVRAAVPGGWLIRSTPVRMESMQGAAYRPVEMKGKVYKRGPAGQPAVLDHWFEIEATWSTVTFFPDPDHTWSLD